MYARRLARTVCGNPDAVGGTLRHNLIWDDVRELFDPDLMGSLPDACVPHTSVADWQALLDLVARGWGFEYSCRCPPRQRSWHGNQARSAQL
jgi:hypothetical protein